MHDYWAEIWPFEVCEASAGAGPPSPPSKRLRTFLEMALSKEWIEILKFWIQFFTNFRNFTDFSSKFCKISGIFNEFRHFGTCSRNPDKISSKFRWEIAFFMKKSEISIEISIFNLAKLWLIFLWNFEVWAVQRYANLVDLEKCWKMSLYAPVGGKKRLAYFVPPKKSFVSRASARSFVGRVFFLATLW